MRRTSASNKDRRSTERAPGKRKCSGADAREHEQKSPSVTVIGAGNWGTALALALHHAGIPLREIVTRGKSRSHSAFASAIQARATTLEDAALDADVLWICTPDATIPTVAAELAARLSAIRISAERASGKSQLRTAPIVFHSSGAMASAELAVLKKIGASVASVHPLMTFPPTARLKKKIQSRSFADVPFAIEGDARACRMAKKLVRALEGEPFPLSAKNKAVYHAFSVFASPMLVALLTAATETAALAGYTPAQARRWMRPIVDKTIANFFANGSQKSFSGPIPRGDVATIQRHLQVLDSHPRVASLYRELSRYSLHALPSRNRRELERALDDRSIRRPHPQRASRIQMGMERRRQE